MIHEYLQVWTYYDCSYTCYLFNKFEMNCLWMHLTPAILIFVFGLGIYVTIKNVGGLVRAIKRRK